MTRCEFKPFSELIQAMVECFGRSISAQGVALRFRLLERFNLAEVEKAALSIMATRKYTSMPTPADFLEHLGGGSAEDRAEVETGKVLAAIGKYGAYASVVFDDSVTQAVIAHAYGGWAKLCADCGVEESEKWFRKDFAKTWAAYARQGVACTGHLPGLTEIANNANCYSEFIPQPKLIDDSAKARAVLTAENDKRMPSEGPTNLVSSFHALPVLGMGKTQQAM